MSKRTDSAEHLKAKWNVEVEDAYYHVEGLFYNPLFNFPGAYFDENGYVIFKTEEEYKNCQYLKMSYGK